MAADADVASRKRRVDIRLVVDLYVAGGMDLALHRATQTHIAIDVELADQSVAWTEGDNAPLDRGRRFGRRLIRR
jgi:hypothetical protein